MSFMTPMRMVLLDWANAGAEHKASRNASFAEFTMMSSLRTYGAVLFYCRRTARLSPPRRGVKIVVEDNNRHLAMLRRGNGERFLEDFEDV
jgi:hypothetical protein